MAKKMVHSVEVPEGTNDDTRFRIRVVMEFDTYGSEIADLNEALSSDEGQDNYGWLEYCVNIVNERMTSVEIVSTNAASTADTATRTTTPVDRDQDASGDRDRD